MEEIWKDVIGYEGHYQVSNFGNVKSLKRTVIRKDGFEMKIKEKILKVTINSRGYYIVKLCRLCKFISASVHQLVAVSFLNHIQKGGKIVINHIDLNRLNNNLSNLEIVSQRKNCNRKHIPHSSKYTGVSWDKFSNKWHSQIYINGKLKNLGLFNKEYDAYLVYENKLLTLNE